MKFLLPSDFNKIIRQEILEVISSDSDDVLDDAERSAISVVTAHLRPRFEVAEIFFAFTTWSRSAAYALGARVVLDAEEYKSSASYAQWTLMSYKGDVYTNSSATPVTGALNLASWTKLGKQGSMYTALAVVAADTTLITAGASWSPGDARNAKVKDIVLDLMIYDLYCNRSMRQVPDHRMDRHANAMAYLKELRDGKLEDPDLPLRIDADGATDNLIISGGKTRFRGDY
jgi:hypothetical protein